MGRGGAVRQGQGGEGRQVCGERALNQPPALLLHTLAQLRARHRMRPSKVPDYIQEVLQQNPMLEENGFALPSTSDCLFCKVCDKDLESQAVGCDEFHTMRQERKNHHPVVHYGVIASANQVVKDAVVRDRLRDEYGAFCVEMEAAGLNGRIFYICKRVILAPSYISLLI